MEDMLQNTISFVNTKLWICANVIWLLHLVIPNNKTHNSWDNQCPLVLHCEIGKETIVISNGVVNGGNNLALK